MDADEHLRRILHFSPEIRELSIHEPTVAAFVSLYVCGKIETVAEALDQMASELSAHAKPVTLGVVTTERLRVR